MIPGRSIHTRAHLHGWISATVNTGQGRAPGQNMTVGFWGFHVTVKRCHLEMAEGHFSSS